MPLSDYARPSPARLRLYASLLVMLVLTAVVGRRRPGELGTRETLRRSAFARVMFMDIGTLGALYLVLNGRTRVRVPAAVASLFAGSFALLPTLMLEDAAAMRAEREGRVEG